MIKILKFVGIALQCCDIKTKW